MLLLWTLACTEKEDGITATDDSGTSPSDTGTATTQTGTTDTDTTDTGTTDTGTLPRGCRATPAAADRDRDVIVALPYTANGRPADVWAVLTLSTAGDLVDDGVRLTMGRSYLGEVVFTPDASLALTPTEDGHVAVYDAVGGNVVHEEYDGGFYAVRVVMDPSGEVAWIIDGNWAKNGGGLWRVDIDCTTGELSNPERVLEAKLPADLLFLEEGPPVDGMVRGRRRFRGRRGHRA